MIILSFVTSPSLQTSKGIVLHEFIRIHKSVSNFSSVWWVGRWQHGRANCQLNDGRDRPLWTSPSSTWRWKNYASCIMLFQWSFISPSSSSQRESGTENIFKSMKSEVSGLIHGVMSPRKVRVSAHIRLEAFNIEGRSWSNNFEAQKGLKRSLTASYKAIKCTNHISPIEYQLVFRLSFILTFHKRMRKCGHSSFESVLYTQIHTVVPKIKICNFEGFWYKW